MVQNNIVLRVPFLHCRSEAQLKEQTPSCHQYNRKLIARDGGLRLHVRALNYVNSGRGLYAKLIM